MHAWTARLSRLRGGRAALVALGLGALSALALPPLHVLPVLFLAVPGLLALLGSAPNWKAAAWRGFCFGLGHHLVGLYWITEAILIEAARYWWFVPLAVPALSATLALFIAAPCVLAWFVPAGGRRALVLAGGWMLGDLARQFVGGGFPWDPWGTMWAVPGAFGDVMLQPAAWIGVYGLTGATLLLAALPALLPGRRGWLAAAVGLAVWAGAGAARLASVHPGPAPGISVVLVQGNVAQGQKWNRALVDQIFTRYLGLTHAATAGLSGSAVVVWPETASPYLLGRDANARAAIAAAAGAPVLAGTVRFDAAGRPRNSLMAILGAGPPVAIYDKWHLVPFGEYQPDWFPLPIQVVPGGGFAPGAGPETLHVPGVPPAGALICYEAIYPGQVIDAADRPDWMVNVTNDAWFGNSTGPRQHLAAARLRAVEEGLPLMRAANTGISVGFDAFGHELGRIGMRQSGTLVLALPGQVGRTLFARFGLAIPLLLALLAMAAAMVPGLFKK